MMLLFIGMEYSTKCVKQTVQRMGLVFSNLIEQVVRMIDRTVIFDFIANTKQWLKSFPMRLQLASQ